MATQRRKPHEKAAAQLGAWSRSTRAPLDDATLSPGIVLARQLIDDVATGRLWGQWLWGQILLLAEVPNPPEVPIGLYSATDVLVPRERAPRERRVRVVEPRWRWQPPDPPAFVPKDIRQQEISVYGHVDDDDWY